MFEITIKNLEDGKVTDYTAEGCCMLLMRVEGDEKHDVVDVRETSVDKMSNVIARNGRLRAAARIGVAKYDGDQDVKDEESRRMLDKIFKSRAKDRGELVEDEDE